MGVMPSDRYSESIGKKAHGPHVSISIDLGDEEGVPGFAGLTMGLIWQVVLRPNYIGKSIYQRMP